MDADVTDPYNNFVPPPECPVFTPTEEEFQDPLAFIAKIRPVASKTGICKIRPPPDWQPPFAAPVDSFKFVPRIQRLNELEARSRVKLNFLDRLFKFWELQGTTLKIPQVGRKLLDMQALYSLVEEEGGMEHITKERKWSRIASKLGFPTAKGQGSIIKGHYERLLYPFYLFKKGQTVVTADQRVKQQMAAAVEREDKKDEDYKPYPSYKLDKQRKSKRLEKEDPTIDYSANSEMRKLQFFGAGPKAAVPPNPKDEDNQAEEDITDPEKPLVKARIKKVSPGVYASELLTQVDKYHCGVCTRGDGEEFMLLCDGCDDAFHTYCLIPPLPDIPKGDWRCPHCVKQACSKPAEQYGFEQSKNEYNLQSFGEMADHFKSTYFNMPVHRVTTKMVEKEFWRLVSSLEEDVCVLYGADIHAMDMGSGFPTKATPNLMPEDEEYINSGWNLNNLPVLEQSVLCHINADISGMKVPWCYVGMCFSSFCWHIEDHWSYSINYLHWGEPKTWYGCPGSSADQFEEVMRQSAPELFEQAPDLLHQLTTIINPDLLMKKGVPIYRTDQQAGEFIVTFPRAYHAGFNNGYNFAEAVNFCPADWLPLGRGCIEHYRSLARQCVFSHEELICKMAADPDSLDLSLAATTHNDMLEIVEVEKRLRKRLLDRGTVEAEREAFELLPDDERQCSVCKTTCFLSAVTCPCSPNQLACLHHVDKLCRCPASRHCLRYRYTLDELPSMLHRLKTRAESFDNWNTNVTNALEATGDNKLELWELKDLLQEADEKKFPESELKNTLANAITEAEKCANVANQLVSKKVRTRNRQSLEGKYVAKLTLEELNCFYEQVITLPCVIREAVLIKELVDKVVAFQEEAQEALTAEVPDSRQLEKLIDIGITLDVDLPEIPRLKQVLQQARWLDEMYSTLKEPQTVTLDVMRKLIESGVTLAPHPALESAMAHLQDLLTVAERWEEKARICLQARPRHLKSTLEAIINESKSIPAFLPNVCALREAVRKANEWVAKVEAIQTSESYPYLDVLEGLVNKGRPIPVRLEQLPQLESQVAAAKSWRERTARTFLKKNSTYTLLEVLSPRQDIGIYNSGKNKKKKAKDVGQAGKDGDNNNVIDVKTEGETRDPAAIVATFKMMEGREVDMMRDLRVRNMEKANGGEGDNRFCICRKGASGFMLQCELCKDWFHGTCVPLPKSATAKAKPGQPAMLQTSRDLKFLCPVCLQSRRPRLETILSLLVSLQKLPVRLAEGEALQCLTERAMAWQDRGRQMLTTPELASALATLSVLSQRRQEQAAREKTEKIISAELRKAASNPELQGHLASVTQSAFGRAQIAAANGIRTNGSASPREDDSSTSPHPGGKGEAESPKPDGESLADDIGAEVDIPVVPSLGMSSEHAYSSVSKVAANGSPRKHARKTPLVPRQSEWPLLEISDTMRAQLEELMMEGDLLEVTLDETQHIWKLLQACHVHADARFLDFQDTENMVGGGVKEGRGEKKLVKVKRLKDKDGVKANKAKVKLLKEKKKLKRKKPAAVSEENGVVANTTDTPGGTTTSPVSGEVEGGGPVKKIKVEPGAVGSADKPLKKKMKRKDKVQLKVNKDGFESRPIVVAAKLKEGLPGLPGDKLKKKKKKLMKLKQEAENANKEGEKKKRVKKVKVKKEKSSKDDSDDDNDEDCAAPKCLKPIGEAVNWVQCDCCELWFHLKCVGLDKEEIKEDEEYMCRVCRRRPGSTAPDGTHIKQEPHDDGFNTSANLSAINSDLAALKTATAKMEAAEEKREAEKKKKAAVAAAAEEEEEEEEEVSVSVDAENSVMVNDATETEEGGEGGKESERGVEKEKEGDSLVLMEEGDGGKEEEGEEEEEEEDVEMENNEEEKMEEEGEEEEVEAEVVETEQKEKEEGEGESQTKSVNTATTVTPVLPTTTTTTDSTSVTPPPTTTTTVVVTAASVVKEAVTPLSDITQRTSDVAAS
ncbi:hypothetical protein V1264_020234 [Littorina saxatilis]|uniref:[histone H3]-trimethyl-L-lysine(4) demethylase n=1 Tax=Littorina saxatilis TaxID=31220 RepID=A0AAN9GAN0_9CAEN